MIAIGAIAGAWARYGMSVLFIPLCKSLNLGTLFVNLLGSFIIGTLFSAVDTHFTQSSAFRFLMITGFLGSFTTFSGFTIETLQLLRQREVAMCTAHIILQVGGGILATFAGYFLIKRLAY